MSSKEGSPVEQSMLNQEAFANMRKLYDSINSESRENSDTRKGTFVNGTEYTVSQTKYKCVDGYTYKVSIGKGWKINEFAIDEYGLRYFDVSGGLVVGNKFVDGSYVKLSQFNSCRTKDFSNLSLVLVNWFGKNIGAKSVEEMTPIPINIGLSPEFD